MARIYGMRLPSAPSRRLTSKALKPPPLLYAVSCLKKPMEKMNPAPPKGTTPSHRFTHADTLWPKLRPQSACASGSSGTGPCGFGRTPLSLWTLLSCGGLKGGHGEPRRGQRTLTFRLEGGHGAARHSLP